MFSHRYKKTRHEPRIKGTFTVKDCQKGHGQKLQATPAPTSLPNDLGNLPNRSGGLEVSWCEMGLQVVSCPTKQGHSVYCPPLWYVSQFPSLCFLHVWHFAYLRWHDGQHQHGARPLRQVIVIVMMMAITICWCSQSSLSSLLPYHSQNCESIPWKKGNPEVTSPDLSQYCDLWFVNEDMDCMQYTPTRARGGLHLSTDRNLGFDFWRFQVLHHSFPVQGPQQTGWPKARMQWRQSRRCRRFHLPQPLESQHLWWGYCSFSTFT